MLCFQALSNITIQTKQQPKQNSLHQRQATSTWWCSSLPYTGEGRNGLSNITIQTKQQPKQILISMLLLISGDIHPNPGPIDPCSVCSRRVTWGNRSIQCTGCSLWVHLSCSGLSPADFRKISPAHSWTCPMCPSSSQPLSYLPNSNPVSSFFSVSPSSHTPNPPPPLTNNHKTISSKTKPSSKTTSNKLTYLPNHPQLIYTYPPSALTTPSQTQRTTSPLTQSSFHPSSPSRNNLRILQWNAKGIRPRRTELLHFLIISTISSSYKSHISPLTPPSVYPATKPSKRTVL